MAPLWTLLYRPTLVVAAFFSLYIFALAIYRLYFSPIAKFPGRRLAALTLWYEFYYQVIKGGRFVWEVEKMHQEYGPIVRINPYELHVNDPDYYDELYNFKKYDKYGWHVQQFGHPASSANTVTHQLHKMRRGAIASYFARGMILRLEKDVIQKTVEKLCKRIEDFQTSKKPLPLGTAYRAFTTDVITDYTMGTSFNFLDRPDFYEKWFDEFLENVRLVHTVTHYPWLPRFAKRLPSWLRGLLLPKTAQLLEFHHVVEEVVVQVKNTPNDGQKSAPSVFYELFHADVPDDEKTVDRLTEEGILFVVAGNETTGNALSIMTFHILSNPTVLQKLKKELIEVMPDPKVLATWQALEKLPYLSAVITEGLRLSYGVVSRMPRVAPNTALRYKDWEIPPNTPVSMNNYYVHNNPDIFTNPLVFLPERWLQPNSKDLEKYFVAFSRGTRMCTGMNLAYAELYVTIAMVFRRFDMELFETTTADVEVAHEYHIPQVALRNFGQKEFILEPQDTIRGDYSAHDLPLTVIGDLSYDGCTDVFTAVQSSSVAYGVVPFENSINGAVVGTLDLLADRQNQYADVHICDEASIDIHHYLLGHACKTLQQNGSTISGDSTRTNQARDLPDTRTKPLTDLQHIKRIYSHPQAFGQSRRFLSHYLKDVDRQEVSSTSKGAEIVSQDSTNTTASISSKDAAETHGLDVLAESIEDQDNNQTRFFFLCKTSSYADPPPFFIGQPTDNDHKHDNSDKWKTFVTFKINHIRSEALADVLHVFKAYGLNPTSINSRPSHRYPWHYIFFVEFYGRKEMTGYGKGNAALAKLEEISDGCRWYGSWRVKKRHELEAAG